MTACLKIIGCCKPQRLRHRGSCFSEVGRFRQWFPILTSPDLWMRPFSHLLYVYWSWFIPRLCRRFSRGPFFFFFLGERVIPRLPDTVHASKKLIRTKWETIDDGRIEVFRFPATTTRQTKKKKKKENLHFETPLMSCTTEMLTLSNCVLLELSSCMKVEVAILGSPSLISLTGFVGVRQQWTCWTMT